MQEKRRKKLLIAGMGLGKKVDGVDYGYSEADWFYQSGDEENSRPLGTAHAGFALMAKKDQVDNILLLGTHMALNKSAIHYGQIKSDFTNAGFNESQIHEELIDDLINPKKFWNSFQTLTQKNLFQGPLDLYVDLTFGYRNQPILVFLTVYFLSELNKDIELKNVYYCMLERNMPIVVNFNEMYELLKWIKSAQMLTVGGNGQQLHEMMEQSEPAIDKNLQLDFLNFSSAYAFNYVNDLQSKANTFISNYRQKAVRRERKENNPALALLDDYLFNFVRDCEAGNPIDVQMRLAARNFQEGNFARSVIILREALVTMICDLFDVTKNEQRKIIEQIFINNVYFWRTQRDESDLTFANKKIADRINKTLNEILGSDLIDSFYKSWQVVRDIRNDISHIRNRVTNERINYSELIELLEKQLVMVRQIKAELDAKVSFREELKQQLSEYLVLKKKKKKDEIFLIINQGTHPIKTTLEKQFGKSILMETLTEGNCNYQQEPFLAKRTRELIEKYHGYKFYIVPGGYTYMATFVYGLVQQSTGKHPVWLQFDSEKQQYIEKNLDPRGFINGGNK